MGETRVNLKHLLEDIRDGYPFPIEEAIIVELIANALDSKASAIHFLTCADSGTLTVIDDGVGMSRRELEEYHDIAATTKVRGKGIGFAGVGAKLALLVAHSVVTETLSDDFYGSTRWSLESPQKAPWQAVDPAGAVDSASGSAVSIVLRDHRSSLLDPSYVQATVQRHFHPLLDEQFGQILGDVYDTRVCFFVNEEQVMSYDAELLGECAFFLVCLGRRKKPVGIGFLRKSTAELPENEWGLAISTYGKVIKRGWDWIGITPRHPNQLSGIVEVPELSTILTTNKADFLRDSTSLQKYYRYRKAIQEPVQPVLRELGEVAPPRERKEKDVRPLEKEIQKVLSNLLDDFPELSSLMGKRGRGKPVTGVLADPEAPPIGKTEEGVAAMTGTLGGKGMGAGVDAAPGYEEGQRIEPGPEPTERGRVHEGRRRRPSLMIGFEEDPDREELGWLLESTLWINESHPAYRRAVDTGAETYHQILTAAWVLSNCVEAGKSAQDFINRFLSVWGARV